MPVTAAIVQARMGSTRLPGKVMKALAGRTVLSHVLERCRAAAGVDIVCCATTTDQEDDLIAAEAARLGAAVFRGSATDVLARYAGAARMLGADQVLRVTSDCPAIDPAICAALLELRAAAGADYAANNMPRSWPSGLDCEAFTAAALYRAEAEAAAPHEREHVSPWLRASDTVRRANLVGPGGALAEARWTLDYPEDYALLTALFDVLSAGCFAMDATAAALADHPEIAALNRMHCDASPSAAYGPLAVSRRAILGVAT